MTTRWPRAVLAWVLLLTLLGCGDGSDGPTDTIQIELVPWSLKSPGLDEDFTSQLFEVDLLYKITYRESKYRHVQMVLEVWRGTKKIHGQMLGVGYTDENEAFYAMSAKNKRLTWYSPVTIQMIAAKDRGREEPLVSSGIVGKNYYAVAPVHVRYADHFDAPLSGPGFNFEWITETQNFDQNMVTLVRATHDPPPQKRNLPLQENSYDDSTTAIVVKLECFEKE